MIGLRVVCCVGLGMVLMPWPVLASGNVTVTTSGGKLVVIGDDGDNVITIDQMGVGANEFRVVPDATNVNNSMNPATFGGVTSGFVLTLGAGADDVTIDST